jgi:hypothetical protein
VYVNGKMRPVKTIPGMERVEGEWEGRLEFKYDIFDILKEFLQMTQMYSYPAQ